MHLGARGLQGFWQRQSRLYHCLWTQVHREDEEEDDDDDIDDDDQNEDEDGNDDGDGNDNKPLLSSNNNQDLSSL